MTDTRDISVKISFFCDASGLVPDFAMLLIFFFSLLVMEAREPPKLPTALIYYSSTNNSSSQPSSTSPPSSSYSATSTFVMEATEPLFFFARSAVEPPNVVLAFTVKPSFTFKDKTCHHVLEFFVVRLIQLDQIWDQ